MTANYYDQEDLPDDIPTQLYDLIAEARKRDIEPDALVNNGEVELKSTEPVDVVRYYLCTRRMDWSDATFSDNSYDLTRFLEFCEYAGIDDLDMLSSRHMEEFREWRKRDGNINLTTLEGQLTNIRGFLRRCERLEIIEEGIADSIEMPDLEDSDEVSYVRIESEEAEAILDHHETFDYATRAHAEFALIWGILCRLGGCRGLDLDNYKEDDDGQKYIEFHHDPDEDTPLKNQDGEVEGEGGERRVNIPDWVAEILDDYIEEHRIDTTDEYGREPLFTTKHGRVSTTTVQRDLYRITQPCQYGQGCPVGKDPEQCEAVQNIDRVSTCPENVSPHPVRRGGICDQIQKGVPKGLICERADVSREVLDKHYDLRSKEEARIQRRKELRKHLDGYGTGDQSDSEREKGTSVTVNGSAQSISPLVDDVVSMKEKCEAKTGQLDLSTLDYGRTAKGVTGYAAFVLMTGIDIALLLI